MLHTEELRQSRKNKGANVTQDAEKMVISWLLLVQYSIVCASGSNKMVQPDKKFIQDCICGMPLYKVNTNFLCMSIEELHHL